MPSKLTNRKNKTLIASFHGIDIYGQFQPAKRTGKDRIWIQLRQPDPRPFRVSESLSYARGVDVLFEKIE